MTTVAYTKGVLAGDTLVTDRGTRTGHVTKVFKEKDGCLIGIAGCLGSAEAFKKWIRQSKEDREDGCKPELSDSFEALRVLPNGDVEWYGRMLLPSVIASDAFAIGSGTDFALGAMAVGATAEEAVRASMKYDTATGGDVTVVKLKGR